MNRKSELTPARGPLPSAQGEPELEHVAGITRCLLAYCRRANWAGYDPYDALNSRVFRALPFLNFKAARLVLTQGIKRCPWNLRPMLLVPKTANPKGIALFLSSSVKLASMDMIEGTAVAALADTLLAMRSPGQAYSCWGYSFDWQTRAELVPKGSPNIICSTFAANALLDAYERSPVSQWLETSKSTADFILEALAWKPGGSETCFSYTPLGRTEIHNANLLGAAFLGRIGSLTGQKQYLETALEAARYSVKRQREDGSWSYGEAPHQEWIDNFHTGFNLTALRRIAGFGGAEEFEAAILKGWTFFRDHFFREDGAAKYYHNATYPIDIHSIAQSLLTLVEFEDLAGEARGLASSVLAWATANMWDPRGFFYFQKRPHYTVRTPFMRWSQAWMLLALSTLIDRWRQGGPAAPRKGGLR